VKPEHDEYLEDGEEGGSLPRSIFAAGWFRALLLLAVIAIIAVVGLPYLLRWFEPPVPAPRAQAGPGDRSTPSPSVPASRLKESPAAIPAAPASPTATAVQPAPGGAASRGSVAPPAAIAPATAPSAASKAPAASRPGARAAAEAKVAGASPTAPKARAQAPPAQGEYWVQVGAFQDRRNADRLAEAIRAERLPVQLAPVTRDAGGGNGSRHELLVTGSTVEAVNRLLRGHHSAEAVPGGALIRPALSLREAVELSKRLAGEGLTVKIRQAAVGGGSTYHVVRVGAFPDRARAMEARADLAAKGHAGFLTQGPAR
jgi:cell division septation protein DedD